MRLQQVVFSYHLRHLRRLPPELFDLLALLQGNWRQVVRYHIVFPVVYHAITFQLVLVSSVLLVINIHASIVTEVSHLVATALLCKRLPRHAHLARLHLLLPASEHVVVALSKAAFKTEIILLPFYETLHDSFWGYAFGGGINCGLTVGSCSVRTELLVKPRTWPG